MAAKLQLARMFGVTKYSLARGTSKISCKDSFKRHYYSSSHLHLC